MNRVRSIWLRYGLSTFKEQLQVLEASNLRCAAARENLLLTESQLIALEKAKEEKEAHGEIETEHPGCLGASPSGGWRRIPVMWEISRVSGITCQQTFIGTYTKVGKRRCGRSPHEGTGERRSQETFGKAKFRLKVFDWYFR
jgi:hypothetical protein